MKIKFISRLISLAILAILGIGQAPSFAGTETARVVKYSQDDIVTVHAEVRYSTLIVLPESEEILDFTTGHKDSWIINGAHNLCCLHPAKVGIRSNLNLIISSPPVATSIRICLRKSATSQTSSRT